MGNNKTLNPMKVKKKLITAEISILNSVGGSLGSTKVIAMEDKIQDAVSFEISAKCERAWNYFGDDGDSIKVEYIKEEEIEVPSSAMLMRMEQLELMHRLMMKANENLYMRWITIGPPDDPSEDDFEFIAENDERYNKCCDLFIELVSKTGFRV